MSDAVVISLITSLSTLIALMITSYFNHKKLSKVEGKVDEVHKQTNSMKDELVAEVRKASYAEGVKDEKGAK